MIISRWYKGFIILGLVLFSCQAREKSNSEDEVLLINENGRFRNFSMGKTAEQILRSEPWTPLTQSDTLIVYSNILDVESYSCSLVTYLSFDSFGLFEVQVDAFPKEDSHVSKIEESWSRKLTDEFDSPETLLFSKRWTTQGTSNRKLEVSLSIDTSKDYDELEFVSLNYFEPLKDAI